ncbi:hypothetical protein SCLCIDRAFT_230596 [Scleroderma citrinum Foug A]|uniref:Uncharacterized protein n=1 Tax=Scleroderma citrinum Foug A TaxID=1036808 RepID=A0A0C3E347_9AGAM|nr:hypothetical protein SCLCIDRAFT_230596 [Scleroderma citrinum Foug A]
MATKRFKIMVSDDAERMTQHTYYDGHHCRDDRHVRDTYCHEHSMTVDTSPGNCSSYIRCPPSVRILHHSHRGTKRCVVGFYR